MARKPEIPPLHEPNFGRFTTKVLFVVMVVGMVLIAVRLVELWLTIFAAMVFATGLRLLAGPIARFTPIRGGASVLMALCVVVGVFGTVFYAFGRELAVQVHSLSRDLPDAWARIDAHMRANPIGTVILDRIDAIQGQSDGLFSKLPQFARSVAAIFGGVLVVFVGGIFLAMNPEFYRAGLVAMMPCEHQALMRTCLEACGKALHNWLLGQSIAMLIVGSLVATGLSFAGVPSAAALGLLTGLSQLIPLIGPTASAIPGLILAASHGWQTAAWALGIYVGIQQLEANLITPHIQSHMTKMPPVLVLFAILGFGLLLGPLGVMLAAPLAVVIFTLIKTLYAETTRLAEVHENAHDRVGPLG